MKDFDWFKILVSILVPILMGAFAFQQSQIITLSTKLETYQNAVYPKLTEIQVNIATISAQIGFINERLGNAQILK